MSICSLYGCVGHMLNDVSQLLIQGASWDGDFDPHNVLNLKVIILPIMYAY